MLVDKNIQVICHFFDGGKFEPLKVKILENDDTIAFAVHRIVTMHLSKLNGNPMYIFKCESEIDSKIVPYELHYEISACTWRLYNRK